MIFQFSEISIPIMKYFVEYLCKHCNNLTTLDFPFAISNDDLSDNIINLLTFNYDNGINKLTNLKELSCVYNEVFNENINKDSGKSPKDIYLALSNNICNLNLLYNESMGPPFEANSLSKFISLQKHLFNLFKSLQVLDFRYFDFSGINEEALNSLCLLKNIKKLKLNNCKIYYNLNYWAKNLTKLEVLEFYDNDISINSAKFLTQLFQSSPDTLTKLILNYNKINAKHSSKLTQQIPLYLHSLIHLELRIITIEQLINIFKSCIELTYLNVALSGKKNFKDLGKFIPKSLQKIRFGNLLFKSNELKFFLEECVNNDSKLKYIVIVNCAIKDKYFDVVKEFDVKLIKVSTS
ncbi:unnamed protein product [Rhizophagus irregularis]|nr:unnamed protein product [Rhizophagus irregularis]